MAEKVVLAYSGGLDTSVAVKWLAERYGYDVVAVTVDVGQAEDLAGIEEKALQVGAVAAEVIDAREAFCAEFILPALKANALYEGKYPLVSSLSRPLIARELVAAAHRHGATAVAHGCTGKGNDQVRFEVTFRALDPSLMIVAPVREAALSRDDALAYAEAHGIPVPVKKESPYSLDENAWGRAIEGGMMEEPSVEPDPGAYTLTVDAAAAPDNPRYLMIEFEKGVPVALDGKRMGLGELIAEVGRIAGSNGYGRIDMMENRLVGIKSREVYECPASLSLIVAHRDLEDLTLERGLAHYKQKLELDYAELIYNGLWHSPLRDSLAAFIDATQERVSGWVKLKFYKGSCQVVGRQSPNALYDIALSTYGSEDVFSHESAKGFLDLWGLPIETWARKGG